MGGAPKIKWDPIKDISRAASDIGSNVEKNLQRLGKDAGAILKGNFNNLGSSMLRIAAMGYTGGLSLGMNPDDKKKLLGETGSERMEREGAEKAAEIEQETRAGLYNDALTDNTLDAKTRQELVALYQSGAGSSDIAATLSAAKAGKGVFGIRRINDNQKKVQDAQPGRSQLVTALGRGTSLI